MTLKRNWVGQKRIVCDGCGLKLPLWKAVGWVVSSDNRRTYHPDCPKQGSGLLRPLTLLSAK